MTNQEKPGTTKPTSIEMDLYYDDESMEWIATDQDFDEPHSQPVNHERTVDNETAELIKLRGHTALLYAQCVIIDDDTCKVVSINYKDSGLPDDA